MDFTQARKNVIEQQLRPWGSLNDRANQALSDTPRESFVPEGYQALAFADFEIPLNDSAKMLSPKIEGRILDTLDIQSNENVLEIGTGSGYLTAVLAELAQSVVSIEIDEKLSVNAKQSIKALERDNVELKVSDASVCDFKGEQFDVIVIGCALPETSERYQNLLKSGGRLFAIIGSTNHMQATLTTRLSEDEYQSKSIFETQLDYMIGTEPKVQFAF